MINPKYYPRLTLEQAIKEDLIHPGEIVAISDATGSVYAYKGPIEDVPEEYLKEYVNFIHDRLSASGCKLNDVPMDCIPVNLLFIYGGVENLTDEKLMEGYDYFHKTAIVNKIIRDEILRRMKEK